MVEGARLESVFRLNRLTWVRIPPHPPLKQPRMGLFFMAKKGEERAHVRVGSFTKRQRSRCPLGQSETQCRTRDKSLKLILSPSSLAGKHTFHPKVRTLFKRLLDLRAD